MDYDMNMMEYTHYIQTMEIQKINQLKELGSVGVLDPYGIYKNPLTDQPFSPKYRELAVGIGDKKGWQTQLTYEQRFDFFRMLVKNQVVLVIAGTGVGKTVIIPKLFSHYFGYEKAIVVTIPTRKAVISSAGYAALCMDVESGQEVGYAIGGEKKMSSNTKVLYATDGFVKSYIGNPENADMPDYDGIIIDEAHLRSERIDVLLALVCSIAQRRPEFRIVIMSASMDAKPFINYFDNLGLRHTLYEPHGPQSIYEVKDIYMKQDTKPMDIIPNLMVAEIVKYLDKQIDGNILGFIATKPDIVKVIKALQESEKGKPYAGKIYYIGFHSGSSDEELQYVTGIKSYKNLGNYTHKVIIATNAVEASVTFEDNLTVVVDSGLEFRVTYDPVEYCNVMKKDWISQSNIKQRRGRTGRTNAGTCIHLYSKKQFDEFKEFQDPDILKVDCTDTFLTIMNLPINGNFERTYQFMNGMITPPTLSSQTVAIKNLYRHNLLGLDGLLTDLGNFVTNFNIIGGDYKMVKSIIGGYYFGVTDFMLILSAIYMTGLGLDKMFQVPKGCDFKYIFRQMPRDFEFQKEQLAFNKKAISFFHPYGDHLTLSRIYLETVKRLYYHAEKEIELMELEENYEDEFKTQDVIFRIANLKREVDRQQYLRKQFCQDNYLNYNTLLQIDEKIEELKKEIQPKLIEIALFNLFDIDDPVQNGIIEHFKDNYDRQFDYGHQMEGGGQKLLNSLKFGSVNDISEKYLECLSCSEDDMEGGGGKDAKKKKPKPIIDYKYRDKVIKNLDKITLQGLPRMKLKRFNQKQDNIMGSLFFGFYTNIAGSLAQDTDTFNNDQYLIKYTPNSLCKVNESTLTALNKKPKYILYSSYMIITGQKKIGLVSKIPVTVMNRLGVEL